MRTLLLMAVGVVAVSLSGPLMAAMVVPPLAIAFWRNGFATAALAPGVHRRRDELAGLRGRPLGLGRAVRGGARAALRHLGDLADADVGGLGDGDRLPADRVGGRLAAAARRAVRTGVLAGLVLAFAGVLVVSGVDFTLSTAGAGR